MMETPYISAKEAAEVLGRSQRRINQLVVDGDLRAVLIGNANAIERASLDSYIRKIDRLFSGRNHKSAKSRRGESK